MSSSAVAEPYALQLAGDWARASAFWTGPGCPYEAALALADADEDKPLRRALAELQALEARPAAAIVSRRLRERGVRSFPRGPRPATRQNPHGLTRRQLEVLVLVADGLSNGQIAARLVLSERTVDHHVGAILRKLGVRTRAEASAKAVRLGLTVRSRAAGAPRAIRGAPARLSAVVEGCDERVGARIQPGRVRVPEPDVHGDQQRVPEGERCSRLRCGGRA